MSCRLWFLPVRLCTPAPHTIGCFSFCLVFVFLSNKVLAIIEGCWKDTASLFSLSFQCYMRVPADIMFSTQTSVKIHIEFPFNLFLLNTPLSSILRRHQTYGKFSAIPTLKRTTRSHLVVSQRKCLPLARGHGGSRYMLDRICRKCESIKQYGLFY